MHGSLCRRCHKAATTADGRKLWLPVSSAHNVCGIGGLYERRNDAGLHDRHTQYCLCGCQTTVFPHRSDVSGRDRAHLWSSVRRKRDRKRDQSGSAFQHELRAFNRYDSYVCDRHADHGASVQEDSGCDSSQKAHDLRSVADCFSHVLWCHVCEQLYRSYPDTVDQYPEGKPGNQYHA